MQQILHIFLFFIPLNNSVLLAQNPVIESMSKHSNLPDIEFYDIIEDHQNYIWLAAEKGLCRYDGKTYQFFSHDKQKSNSVFELQLDDNGTLWCINIYGQIFYIEDDCLKLFYDGNKLVKGQLSPFVINKTHLRLFSTTGIYDISRADKSVHKLLDTVCLSAGFYEDETYVFTVDKTPTIENHIIYKIKDQTVSRVLDIGSGKRIQSPKVFNFELDVLIHYKTQNKNIIHHLNKVTNTFKSINVPRLLEDVRIYKIIKNKNDYWFLTTSGVYIFDIYNEHLVFKEQLFNTESITDVIVDFNKNYWFSTLDNGVFVAPNLGIRSIKLQSLHDKITASCSVGEASFILGTNKGKLLFYKNNRLINTIKLPVKNVIGNLFYDEENTYVIVSINASDSYVLDVNTMNYTYVKNKFSVAKSISKLKNNTIFYGNYKEGIVYNAPLTSDSLLMLKKDRVKTSIVKNDSLYVSYINGLYIYDSKKFKTKELTFKGNRLLVNSMAKVSDTVWFATQHKGVLKRSNNTFEYALSMLPNNCKINTIKSEDYFLWISSDCGLYRYNTKLQILQLLSLQDGLNITVNDFVILRDKIIVIMPNGFYVLPKNDELFKDYKTSRVYIESVKINGRDTLVKSFYKLPYHLNKIEINFNSNGFESHQHVAYQYRIKALDTAWQNLPLNTHFIRFNSLASGMYDFELKAKNVSAKSAVLAPIITFEITKPFWQMWWFYGLIFIGIFGVIWFYFRRRLEQKEKQRIAEIDKILIDKKITNLRLENLRSQMNPHFIFNALNSIQDYIVSNEKELASSYLVKFSRLIRMYLEYSQQNEITLEEELKALKLYLELEKVRFEDELDYTINVAKNLKTPHIKVPSLFIQPYVENALKHGLLHKSADRKLNVKAQIISQNKLQITVEDNGIGREQSEKIKQTHQQHKPFATKANEERVHLYKNKLKRDITITIEDLKHSDQTASGTKVFITMSIS